MQIFAIYKNLNETSFAALGRVKKYFNTKKVGHLGTLDPLAEGVLVVAVNEATKLIPYIETEPKEYVVEVFFGHSTPTFDAEGVDKKGILSQARPVEISKERLLECLEQLKLAEYQTPPGFSAIKIDGVRAYALARKGELDESKIKPKKVELFEFELLEFELPIVKLRLLTGSGYYVRSLVRDLGIMLGEKTFMYSLIRTKVGKFEIESCRDLIKESSFELVESEFGDLFKNYCRVDVDLNELADLKNGKKVLKQAETNDCANNMRYVLYEGKLVGLANYNETEKCLIPIKNFNS